MNVLRDISEYAGKYYSHKWIRKNVLHQAEDEMEEIDNEITDEKGDSRYSGDEDEGGGFGLNSQKSHSKELDLINEQNINEKIDLKIDEMKDETHLKDEIQNVFDTILNERSDA
jgi:hypothetical protein